MSIPNIFNYGTLAGRRHLLARCLCCRSHWRPPKMRIRVRAYLFQAAQVGPDRRRSVLGPDGELGTDSSPYNGPCDVSDVINIKRQYNS